MNATPGGDIEDSRAAARLGELGGIALAAIALVMPGIGPIVAAGPLSSGLGGAAGPVAGGVSGAVGGAGLAGGHADAHPRDVERGAGLMGVHGTSGSVSAVQDALAGSGATRVDIANWSGE